MNRRLRIAFVLHGKFEAFELALAFISKGHEVKIFTNYPAFVLKKFHCQPTNTERLVLHGVLSRLFIFLYDYFKVPVPEKWLFRWFGRWAQQRLKKKRWDLIFGMSGVSEEFLRDSQVDCLLTVLIRASAHILTQKKILDDEKSRVGVLMDQPSCWMVARELSEYNLADKIRVLSRFSFESFIANGVDPDKLWVHPPASTFSKKRIKSQDFTDRTSRILSGAALRVLYVGNLSFQKGIYDLHEICNQLSADKFEFNLVGKEQMESKKIIQDFPVNARFMGKKRQTELEKYYQWADVFIYPTLQDGFAMVLSEAMMAGLPILTTTNCGSNEIVRNNRTGWIFPARRADLFVEKLIWCDQNRSCLAAMVVDIEKNISSTTLRSWEKAAEEAEVLMRELCFGVH